MTIWATLDASLTADELHEQVSELLSLSTAFLDASQTYATALELLAVLQIWGDKGVAIF